MIKKKLVWEDIATRVVLKSVVVGHFAMWAVRQSPYLLPEELEKGIGDFDKYLISNINAGKEYMIETTYKELRDIIRNAITKSDTISLWNIAKKGTGPIFVTRYDEPEPDYDFIALDALARNVAHSVWLEIFYDDGGFEQ